MKEHLSDVKIEIITQAVESGRLSELNEKGFFKTMSQIERARKLSTGSRIWIGRMLKLVFDKSAPNPGGVAIFQRPNQFKAIREWDRKNK